MRMSSFNSSATSVVQFEHNQRNLTLDQGLTSRRALLFRPKYAHNCPSIHHSLHHQVLDQLLHCASSQGLFLANGDAPIIFFRLASSTGLSTTIPSSRLLSRSVSFSSLGVKVCEHSRNSDCTRLRFLWCPCNERDRFRIPSWTVQVTCSAPLGDNVPTALPKGMLVDFC
jgi:hypothetical protein